MAHELLLLIIGLAGLWLGAELVVKGSQNLARFFKISELVIGLTVVSIGTSLPEIAVSISGGLGRLAGIETSGIVVGNALGSCLNVITIIMGIAGLVGALLITKRELLRDGLMLAVSIILFFVVSYDLKITRFEGFILIIVYGLYILNLLREEKLYEKIKRPELHLLWDIISLVAGLFFVVYASKMVVLNGVGLAGIWGIKESMIGILIIGLGTGLPELAVSVSALWRKSTGIAIGNLIGSNICDLLLSLGLGTVISGFIVDSSLLRFDVIFVFFTALAVLFLLRSGRRLTKKEAVMLIVIYVVYLGLKLQGF
jgi:cation:H+ antiporter